MTRTLARIVPETFRYVIEEIIDNSLAEIAEMTGISEQTLTTAQTQEGCLLLTNYEGYQK